MVKVFGCGEVRVSRRRQEKIFGQGSGMERYACQYRGASRVRGSNEVTFPNMSYIVEHAASIPAERVRGMFVVVAVCFS